MINDKPKNFKFCEMSLYLANKSLLEISNILSYKSYDSNPISRSDTFKFYLFTLHYTFILEITKLLEKGEKGSRNNHFASLEKINEKLYNISGNKYYDIFQDNIKRIEGIRCSSTFKKILTLRDSKVAHIDNCKKVKPFEFESFTDEEIKELFQTLSEIKLILNNCLSIFGGEYYLPSFTRTSNFLSFLEEYRAFAHSRPVEFWNWKNENYE